MTRLIKYLFLCMVLITLNACKPVTEFSLYGHLFGEGVELAAGGRAPWNHWAGQWRVVNIWAEWCKPCWQEIPELNEYYQLQVERDSDASEQVKLLGYNYDELTQEELGVLTKKMDIHFPVVVSWPQQWAFPEIKGLPATLIIAPDDSVLKVLWGPQTLVNLNKEVDALKKNFNQGS